MKIVYMYILFCNMLDILYVIFKNKSYLKFKEDVVYFGLKWFNVKVIFFFCIVKIENIYRKVLF